MAVSHQTARAWVIGGYQRTYGATPDAVIAQIEQAVALLETGYGQGWRNEGKGSNNMGAIQAGQPPCHAATAFLYTDTNPTDTGASIPYQICFKRYPSPDLGMADLTRVMYQKRPTVLAAAKKGDLYGVSAAMYDTTYYRGFGPNREVRIANHYKTLRGHVNTIAVALGEKMPDGFDPLVRTLKFSWWLPIPSRGDDVRRVQRVVGVNDDGWYGPKTSGKVRDLQLSYLGLKPDGVVGLDTWHVIQEIERKMQEAKEAA